MLQVWLFVNLSVILKLKKVTKDRLNSKVYRHECKGLRQACIPYCLNADNQIESVFCGYTQLTHFAETSLPMAKVEHHDHLRTDDQVVQGSEKAFGIVFACVFAIIGLFPYFFGDGSLYLWSLIVAAIFILVAFIRPSLLKPLNIVWFKFGLLLHSIVNPIIMGIMFFGVVTPIALLFKLTGKDPLKLRFDKSSTSYWVHRDPPGPEPESMRRQF